MSKINRRINRLEQRVSKLEGEHQTLIDSQIVQLLQEINSSFTNKPRYTYSEISEITGRSTGYISNLAREYGLSRRHLTSV